MTKEEAIRFRLEESMGPVGFQELGPHLARDAVFVVHGSLELLRVGVAVALDDAPSVEAWIKSGDLRKPSRAERERWPAVVGHGWVAIIVQPFVLVHEIVPRAVGSA